MNVVILHYHLNQGGVTRVIVNQLLALDRVLTDELPVLVLCGGRTEGWPPDLSRRLRNVRLSTAAIPGLDYDPEAQVSPAQLGQAVTEVLKVHGCSPESTVLHIHNHSLGKNAAWLVMLKTLLADGYGALLQIHDFAEDSRPRNYRLLTRVFEADLLRSLLYPQGGRVHYATLNRRDWAILRRAGVAADRLHFLPNPVLGSVELPDRSEARRRLETEFKIPSERSYVVYPVRGIRRKNVGELVLWSALGRENTDFAITLEPQNPAERPAYERWKRLCAELDLPLHFETGHGLDFESNLASADAVISTSVAEGFGMVFLEGWLAGRPLVGRDLPEITADFRDAGMQLEGLYHRLPVPLPWIDQVGLERRIRQKLDDSSDAFGLPRITDDEWQACLAQKLDQGYIDFGDLDEHEQDRVIRRVSSDPACRSELPVSELNGSDGQELASRIVHNQAVIDAEYSVVPSGQRLLSRYHEVLRSPDRVEPTIDCHVLLSEFLSPLRSRLIRS